MFSKSSLKKAYNKPNAALFLDFDDVIHLSADDEEGTPASIIAQGDLAMLNAFCMKKYIPIYIITNRPDTDEDKTLVQSLIDAVGGCAKDAENGGFHAARMHFLGKASSTKAGKKVLLGYLSTKIKRIQEIHEAELPCVPKSNMLMIDDLDVNLDPIAAAGYQVHRAVKENNDHFECALEFLRATLQSSATATPVILSPAAASPASASSSPLTLSKLARPFKKPKCARALFGADSAASQDTNFLTNRFAAISMTPSPTISPQPNSSPEPSPSLPPLRMKKRL